MSTVIYRECTTHYDCVVQEFEFGVFVHLYVFEWNHSALKELYIGFDKLINYLKMSNISTLYGAPRDLKFPLLFGGKLTDKFAKLQDGSIREVFEWTL